MTGRPATTWGTSITPGNNTFPAYTEILGNTAYDCFGIAIFVHTIGSSGAAKDMLLTIGIDHTGGTTYTSCEISNLMCSSAGTLVTGGIWYYFPLYIPEGSAIAAKMSCSNATVGTGRVGVILYGRPTRPELVRAGSYVDSFGATTASSRGTTITAGTASEGSWTEMTSGTTTRSYWWFQCGWGSFDISLGAAIYAMDLSIGDASNKEIVFEDALICNAGTTEQVVKPYVPLDYTCDIRDGQRIYVRLQCSTTADTDLTMMAYALGG